MEFDFTSHLNFSKIIYVYGLFVETIAYWEMYCLLVRIGSDPNDGTGVAFGVPQT